MSYLRDAASTRRTPQSEAIPGAGQVANSAGGFAWEVDAFTRLRRFLILGSEGGSYYAGERKLTVENALAVREAIQQDGLRAVAEIVAVSDGGRAAKNDPAIYALAMAAGAQDPQTRRAALDALPKVCRTATHLFHFNEYVEQFRGRGPALNRAVREWYTSRSLDDAAFQMVKYRQRDGWSHRDLLRLCKPKPGTPAESALYAWAVGKPVEFPALPWIVQVFEVAQKALTPKLTAQLVRNYGLPREALQTEHLNSREVWEALLERMPLTALIRNLPTMTRVGLIEPMSDTAREIAVRITDADALRRSRVHPLSVLTAHLTYAAGHSIRGSSSWTPVREIVDALDSAFYAAFGNVEATGKRHLLALDVSGSMDYSGEVNGVPGLTPRVASSAMAMVTVATGDPCEVVAFTSGQLGAGLGGRRNAALALLSISPRQRLADVCRETSRIPFGGTDCALPWIYATQQQRAVDIGVVYTDSETWAGAIHPSQALQEYRRQSGIRARSVIVGMVSNGFSIADSRDPGQMDCVGFDSATPQVIADFAAGLI